MDIRKLQRAIVDGLEDVKAQNIVVFNTEHLSSLFERVIIASGTSNRQTKALASSVRDTVKSRGLQVMRTEGEDNGEWIIVDCGAAVAHIMQPAIRDYYHLEEIWGGKAVRMKMEAVQTALPKAAPAEAAPARKPRTSRAAEDEAPPPARKAKDKTTRPAASRRVADSPASTPRKGAKTASGKTASGKTASRKTAPAKTARPAKSPRATKAVKTTKTARTAGRRAPARKAGATA